MLKAAAMKVDPFRCDCCPAEHKDLILIETRFEAHRCFAELQCRVCSAFWLAEIGPTAGEPDLMTMRLADQAGWRVLSLTPLITN